ncbi:MAG: cephalosporin hydroxylase family protein [Candidatus Eremiobacteraeota bacterium]|nr:cephalosporin hydroxylase family protein [Candidatus Eremiobacteraeota bacterium]
MEPKDPEMIERMHADPAVARLSRELFLRTAEFRYSYNFSWLGRPIIQYPEDVVALQEIVWKTKPNLIVETGIAHGGSLIFFGSLLALLGGDRLALGVDIEIRPHNRAAIEAHPLARHVRMIEGSSVDPAVVQQVRACAEGRESVMVVLDSNHTQEHVAAELRAYAGLVRKGGYLVVMDTVVEYMPDEAFPNRPWGAGNNPMGAVEEFLAANPRFSIDPEYDRKLLLSVAPRGYLRAVAD